MIGSDGTAYVVKFQNNPQHLRVLVNEWLATCLVRVLGLPSPPCEVVEVTEWLIDNTPELDLQYGQHKERCRAGLHFGSQMVGGLMPGQSFDYLPEQQLSEVRNLADFAGMLAFDKWSCNANGRQAVFHRKLREKRYTATFIDHGFCFGAGEWEFRDAPLRGVFARNLVYGGVTGWESFEPWLTRIRELAVDRIWSAAEQMPPEWYEGDVSALEMLVEKLAERRSRVPEWIKQFRESTREPFPNWKSLSAPRASAAAAHSNSADNLLGGRR